MFRCSDIRAHTHYFSEHTHKTLHNTTNKKKKQYGRPSANFRRRKKWKKEEKNGFEKRVRWLIYAIKSETRLYAFLEKKTLVPT